MRSIGSKDNPYTKPEALGILFLLLCFASPATSSEKQYRTVVFPNQTRLNAEVANTLEARTIGLMFREHLSANEGMLFVFEEAMAHQFWMKNCKISLDLLWLDARGKIVYIVEKAPPCKKDPCPLYGPKEEKALYVIETRSGTAKKNQLKEGMTLRIL